MCTVAVERQLSFMNGTLAGCQSVQSLNSIISARVLHNKRGFLKHEHSSWPEDGSRGWPWAALVFTPVVSATRWPPQQQQEESVLWHGGGDTTHLHFGSSVRWRSEASGTAFGDGWRRGPCRHAWQDLAALCSPLSEDAMRRDAVGGGCWSECGV